MTAAVSLSCYPVASACFYSLGASAPATSVSPAASASPVAAVLPDTSCRTSISSLLYVGSILSPLIFIINFLPAILNFAKYFPFGG